jgi:phage baseplate assembly protein gpV
MSEALWAAIDDLTYQVAETKRRLSNVVRPAVVHQVIDAHTIVADFGSADAPAPTHKIPLFTHGGTGKDSRPMVVGQQVTLLCPDGDLANAFALPGGYHDQNPSPSTSLDEDIVAQRGQARVRITNSEARLEFGGVYLSVSGDGVVAHGPKIVTDGLTYLGGADASNPIAQQGTVDTGENIDVGNLSTKAFTK